MQTLFIFAIKDNLIGTFGNPFFKTHKQAAIRELGEVLNDDKGILAKYPEQFDLYQLGIYKDSGDFLDMKPEFIVSLSQLQQEETNREQKRHEIGKQKALDLHAVPPTSNHATQVSGPIQN